MALVGEGKRGVKHYAHVYGWHRWGRQIFSLRHRILEEIWGSGYVWRSLRGSSDSMDISGSEGQERNSHWRQRFRLHCHIDGN